MTPRTPWILALLWMPVVVYFLQHLPTNPVLWLAYAGYACLIPGFLWPAYQSQGWGRFRSLLQRSLLLSPLFLLGLIALTHFDAPAGSETFALLPPSFGFISGGVAIAFWILWIFPWRFLEINEEALTTLVMERLLTHCVLQGHDPFPIRYGFQITQDAFFLEPRDTGPTPAQSAILDAVVDDINHTLRYRRFPSAWMDAKRGGDPMQDALVDIKITMQPSLFSLVPPALSAHDKLRILQTAHHP